MKKILFLFFILLTAFKGHAQYDSTKLRQSINAYGFDYKNTRSIYSQVIPEDTLTLAVRDSGAIAHVGGIIWVWSGYHWKNPGIYTLCGAPSIVINGQSAIAYDSCGHQFYVYDPTDSAWKLTGITDTALINTIVSDSAKLKQSNLKIYNVVDYGADPTGVNDSRISIQTLLTSLEATGGVVYFPPGNYYIDSTLYYNGQDQRTLTIKGAGIGVTFLTYNGAAGGTMFTTGSWSVGNTAFINVKGITFGSTIGTHIPDVGIMLINKQQSSISYCQFQYMNDGIYLYGVLLSKIDFNRFAACYRDGIHSPGGHQNNALDISNNEFYWTGRWSLNFSDSLGSGPSNGNFIRFNDFEGTVLSSLGSINLTDQTYSTVAFNRFEDGRTDTSGHNVVSILIAGSAQALTIMGNTMGQSGTPKDYYIKVEGNGKGGVNYPQGIHFTSNQFTGQVNIADILMDSTGLDFSSVNDHFNNAVPVSGAKAYALRIIGSDKQLLNSNALKLLSTGEIGNSTGADIFYQNSKKTATLNAAPTTGTWSAGDMVWNRVYPSSNNLGWICSVGGTPGAWTSIPMPTGVKVTFYGKNATLDSTILVLSDGTRYAAKDSIGSGGIGSGWALTGNSGITSGTQFIGTTDTAKFRIKTKGLDAIDIDSSQNSTFFGNISIPVTTATNGIIKMGASSFIHTYGTANTFLGVGAGNFTETTASYSTGIGTSALSSLTTGQFNTGIGRIALQNVTIGGRNVAIGANALSSVNTGSSNVAIGTAALGAITSNSFLTAIGDASMGSTLAGATEDVALGYGSLSIQTTGSYNTAIGSNALGHITTQMYNTAVGRDAGNAATSNNGTFIGFNSGINVSTGANNTIIGGTTGGGITTGSGNTVIGANVGSLATGLTNNIILANGTGAIKAQNDGTNWTITGAFNSKLNYVSNPTMSASDSLALPDKKYVDSALALKADTATSTIYFHTPLKYDSASKTVSLDTANMPGLRPYKVYTALLTQTGTTAPTAVVLENTTGATFAWSYTLAGEYTVTASSGVLTSNKTTITVQNGAVFTPLVLPVASWGSTTTAVVKVPQTSSGTLTDSSLSGAMFEIRIYP